MHFPSGSVGPRTCWDLFYKDTRQQCREKQREGCKAASPVQAREEEKDGQAGQEA